MCPFFAQTSLKSTIILRIFWPQSSDLKDFWDYLGTPPFHSTVPHSFPSKKREKSGILQMLSSLIKESFKILIIWLRYSGWETRGSLLDILLCRYMLRLKFNLSNWIRFWVFQVSLILKHISCIYRKFVLQNTMKNSSSAFGVKMNIEPTTQYN